MAFALAAAMFSSGTALAQSEPGHPRTADQARERAPTLFERNARLIRDLQRLGPWAEQAKLIQQAHGNVFREYGWDSEEDRFGEKLMTDVSQIPPWDFNARFDLAFNRIAERYQLTEDQKAQIKPKLLWNGMSVMGKHVTALFDLSEEILAARLEGRPFTPQEVARWSQLSEPIIRDAHAQFETLAREIEPLLSESQREIMHRDRAAADRRIRTILERMGDWQQGRWRPEEWGLQDDPLHAGERAVAERPVPGEAGDAGQVTPEYNALDPDSWERYLRDFITRYRLDGDQRTAARAILQDLRERADAHEAAMQQEAHSMTLEARMARIYERLFEELRTRLDRIPTDEQRRSAEGAQAPSDRSRTGPAPPPFPDETSTGSEQRGWS